MIATRVFHWRNPAAVAIGLGDLRRQGLTPRGLLFIAQNSLGESYVAIPDDLANVTKIRVGDKLSLKAPWEGRYYHFDSIHRLPSGSGVLWNGDRRLALPGSMSEVAVGIAEWVKGNGARNVFLGCTSHQPGSWWTKDDRTPPVALHERGYVDVVTCGLGLLARRIGYAQLFFARYGAFAAHGADGFEPVFESPFGNILMLERRVLSDRLVLTCERGLVETDLSTVPEVRESMRVELQSGFGVVGRVDGGAFAVTVGKVEPWGLAEVAPALLVGAEGDTLRDLARSLARHPAPAE